jgi:HAD superfamily hydrolase (TIGR01509 family)
MTGSERIKFLFICSGNICRSPMAEILAKGLFEQVELTACEFKSAGTLGIEGQPASSGALKAIEELGLRLNSHVSEGLTLRHIHWADYIVVMEPYHAEAVLSLEPLAENKIKLLWKFDEFGRHLGYVPDPIGSSDSVYSKCRDLIAACLRELANEIRSDLKCKSGLDKKPDPAENLGTNMTTNIDILGVIFDMDGVLCESEPFLFEAAKQMFQERHGLEVKRSDFRPFVGTGEDRYLGGVAESYGRKLNSPQDKIRTYEIYLEIIESQLSPLPGAAQFVNSCKASGKSIALATSADRVKMEGNLRQIGIPPSLFDYCVTGNDIEKKKPDPAIFEAAAEGLSIHPRQSLIVEDAVTGVQAAKAAGAYCLAVMTSFDRPTLASVGADWVTSTLESIPSEVEELLNSSSR